MLSNHSLAPIPLGTPCPADTRPEDDFLPMLDFDELLDIARECEFTRTITHLWPCEESSTFPETGLEDILAAIVPMPYVEESALLLSGSTLSISPDLNLHPVDLHRSTPVCPMPDIRASLSGDRLRFPSPSQADVQVQTKMESPVTSILRGWSPPNGSQFLDLGDNLMLPDSMTDIWVSPWLTTCLEFSNTQSVSNISQSSVVPEIGDVQPQPSKAEPKIPAVSKTDKAADDPARKRLPRRPMPTQPSTRTILEPVSAGPVIHANMNVRDQMVTIPHAKTTKSWPQVSSVPATDSTSSVTYARAPRGGIPPHIARTVTKANILRMEKERKVMQDAFSSASTEERKKPSVLRRAAKGEWESSKNGNGSSTGKESSELGKEDGKGERVAKRARL